MSQRRDELVRSRGQGRRGSEAADAHVGERIRMRRLALGMTQAALRARIGISFQQIQKYELGQKRIGAGRLAAVARVLGVSQAGFFDGLDDALGRPPSARTVREADAIAVLLASAEGRLLAVAWTSITDSSSRRALLALARALARRLAS